MNRLVLGLLRGDEGKGKITDYFSKTSDIVIRYAGSCNAGHTIYRDDEKIVLHQIPSGILHKKLCIIGRGCLIDLKKFWNEVIMLQNLIEQGKLESYNESDNIFDYLKISYGAHLIFQHHIDEDIKREDSGKGNGSTKCGIAPGYRDKYYRTGMRIIDLIHFFEKDSGFNETHDLLKDIGLNTDKIKDLLSIAFDEEEFLNIENNKYKNLLFEGAQGVLLDINSPYYPNVSSSSVGIDGVISGTGINYNKLKNNFNIIGIAKSYISSVGVGQFLTQLDGVDDKSAKLIRDVGNEYGATTGRPRKVGWFDIPLLNYSLRTSGANELCLTRLDTLMEAFKDKGEFKVCVAYQHKRTSNKIFVADIWNLNQYEPIYETFKIWSSCSFDDKNFVEFLKRIQQYISVQIKYLSVGKNEEDILILNDKWYNEYEAVF